MERELTARGRPREEGHRFHGPQIQAASLISTDLPIRLQGQTSERAHCAAPDNC